jgi:hypothetical protein
VPHRLALWGGETRDVGHDRFGHVFGDVGGGALLGVAPDLADHDDEVGGRVLFEGRDRIDVGGADHRIAADADARRESDVRELVHELVGERARLGDEAEPAGPGDVGRGDADVRLAGRDDAGAVRADEPDPPFGGVGEEFDRVGDRDAFGDDHDEVEAGVHRFEDRALRVGGRDEDDRDVRAGGVLRLGDCAEDGNGDGSGGPALGAGADGEDVELHGRARLARVDAADDVRTGAEHAARVLAPLGSGHPLDDDLRVPIEEDRHSCSLTSRPA